MVIILGSHTIVANQDQDITISTNTYFDKALMRGQCMELDSYCPLDIYTKISLTNT